MLTGEPHVDALALLDADWPERGAIYAALQVWPSEYRQQVFAIQDEAILAEQARVRGEIL